MQTTAVTSGKIVSAAYDRDGCSLDIHFGNGEVFRYYGVPPVVYKDLMESASPMGYFRDAIEGRYSFTRLTR